MSLLHGKDRRVLRVALIALSTVSMALLVVRGTPTSVAQEGKRMSAQPVASGEPVARGAYIVNDVAMCPTCHTPRTSAGRLDPARWLQGGPVVYQPSEPTPNWPQLEPRIGGTLPASPEQMVTLLTTAIWIDGKELRDPMPKFHMNRADAEAVVAYLRSLTPR
jgi:mono/diheme cytochrome c family protein